MRVFHVLIQNNAFNPNMPQGSVMLPFQFHPRGFYSFLMMVGGMCLATPLMAVDFKGHFFDVSDREQVRQFYNTVYRSSDGVLANWTGSIESCDAGRVSEAYEAATLRRINWYRAFAGVPSTIVLDETYSRKAQETALLLSANNTLTHFPTSDMRCYSAAGDEGAQKSNLTYGQAGAGSVKNQFEDYGSSNKSVGHRRWLLYPFTQKMGVGNVVPESPNPRIGAVWVLDPPNLASWGAPRPETREAFVAWPPPGFIPYPLVYPRWSFTYPNADFSDAQVTLFRNGEAHPLMLEPYEVGAGENTLVWIPSPYKDGDRWQSVAEDEQYEVIIDGVRIAGALQTFNYSVTIFDPLYSAQGVFSESMLPQGPEQLYRDDEVAFSIFGLHFTDGYEWSVQTILESEARYDAEWMMI
ncbi:Cysteine-rich secretory protein family protein [Nitrincola nitratireducens]|uniref:Cysteine-rich secretory protein family protein n=2 Tax=Nitrincola nitratireducens TaxID=1229521 RepID=W9V4B8_9GAMM|nr:Cysteine-rich secretory protein family protein [Nitrincola nitratireducens]